MGINAGEAARGIDRRGVAEIRAGLVERDRVARRSHADVANERHVVHGVAVAMRRHVADERDMELLLAAHHRGSVFGDLTLCNSKLAKYAFTGASFGKLTVNAPENPSATNHSTVGAYAFASSGSRKTTFKELLVAGEWTEIGTAAFYGCTGLTTVTVTGANVSIGESSFERISALASAALSTGTVGKYAFKNCTSLSSLGASSVSSVGQSAFEGCTQLTAADVRSAASVGSSAFSGCTSLAAVNAQSAQSIGDNTFKNCSLLADVNIQSALSIGNSAFTGCSALKTIDAQSARSIGSSTFYGLI